MKASYYLTTADGQTKPVENVVGLARYLGDAALARKLEALAERLDPAAWRVVRSWAEQEAPGALRLVDRKRLKP